MVVVVFNGAQGDTSQGGNHTSLRLKKGCRGEQTAHPYSLYYLYNLLGYFDDFNFEDEELVGADADLWHTFNTVGNVAGNVKGGFSAGAKEFESFAEAGDYLRGLEFGGFAAFYAGVEHGAVDEAAGVVESERGLVVDFYFSGSGSSDFVSKAAFGGLHFGVGLAEFVEECLAGTFVLHSRRGFSVEFVLESLCLLLEVVEDTVHLHVDIAHSFHIEAISAERFDKFFEEASAVDFHAELLFVVINFAEYFGSDLQANDSALRCALRKADAQSAHDVVLNLLSLVFGFELLEFAKHIRPNHKAII